MPWDESPDYGGPPIRLRDIVGIACALLAGLVVYAVLLAPHPATSGRPSHTRDSTAR